MTKRYTKRELYKSTKFFLKTNSLVIYTYSMTYSNVDLLASFLNTKSTSSGSFSNSFLRTLSCTTDGT